MFKTKGKLKKSLILDLSMVSKSISYLFNWKVIILLRLFSLVPLTAI